MHPLRWFVMLISLAFLLLVAAAGSAQTLEGPRDFNAPGIDSALSGDYVGGGYACQLIVTRFDFSKNNRLPEWARSRPVDNIRYAKTTQLNDLRWRCTSPGPFPEQYIGGVYGPGCPSTSWTAFLGQWGGWPNGIAIRIAAIAGGSITVRIGDFATVQNGGGTPIQFFFVQQQDAPIPFPCR